MLENLTKLEILKFSAEALNPPSMLSLGTKRKQYRNSNFQNYKRFGHLGFKHLNLFRISVSRRVFRFVSRLNVARDTRRILGFRIY
ncbi:hypothetical protein AMJ52_08570 [candidate division TA06 bacterium DG_78]|uniref:Uncharacterized protein n=1 Tax=candidate division TA06 bacterium DG_78 TaxID=1703772 RepID=A0A0S7YAB4_UNCT6|nr:MAG: hypothetical protein AMJ52_08570 [candidate division TA06 bacterium DG_78]